MAGPCQRPPTPRAPSTSGTVTAAASAPVSQLEPGGTRVDVPLGRRVMVVSDLLLTPDATPSSLAVTAELARALDTWDGPGVLIIAGNLFDLTGVHVRSAPPDGPSTPTRPWPGRSSGSSGSTSGGSSANGAPTSRTTSPSGPPARPTGPRTWWPRWPRPGSSTWARSTSTSRRASGSAWCGWTPASAPTPPGGPTPRPTRRATSPPTPSPVPWPTRRRGATGGRWSAGHRRTPRGSRGSTT